MAENKMKGFAELLGLELNEEFKLSGIVDKYKLTIDGIMRYSPYGKERLYDSLPGQVLTGRFEIVKLPKPILDEKEKEYLSPSREQRADWLYGSTELLWDTVKTLLPHLNLNLQSI